MSKEAEKFIKEYQLKHKTGAWDAKCTQAYADECVEKNNEEWRKTLKDIGKLKHLEKL